MSELTRNGSRWRALKTGGQKQSLLLPAVQPRRKHGGAAPEVRAAAPGRTGKTPGVYRKGDER